MKFTGLDHVGFAVSDLDRSIAFYTLLLEEPPMLRKVWDLPYLGEVVGYPNAKLDAAFWRLPGGCVLELLNYMEPPMRTVNMETHNAGNAHLCLTSGDLAQDFERLRGRATFRSSDPVTIPWGPYKGGKAAYLRDPDGISIELIQLPVEDRRFSDQSGRRLSC